MCSVTRSVWLGIGAAALAGAAGGVGGLAPAGRVFAQAAQVLTPPAGEQPGAPAPAAAKARPRVEVVFVLDTTGSMSGLIEAAKQKVWSIANQIVLGEPRPEVRMGLVGYRDRGDAYVTTVTQLTDDLDTVYGALMSFSAEGGGDFPESVNEALHTAVTGFSWTPDPPPSAFPLPSSPAAEQGSAGGAANAAPESVRVLRIIYLVGDAPPHSDYADDVAYAASCEMAAARGIIVNTVRCGSNGETGRVWREIARLGEGESFDVDAEASARAVETPMDEELAGLGTELEATVVAYGTREQIAAQERKDADSAEIAASAPASALADRALYKCESMGASVVAVQDLVTDCTQNGKKIADVKEEDLPEALRAMDGPARERFVQEMGLKRADVQRRIGEVSRQRREYIEKQLAAAGANGRADTFDQAALACLRRQAARAGLVYADAPAPNGSTTTPQPTPSTPATPPDPVSPAPHDAAGESGEDGASAEPDDKAPAPSEPK